MARNMFKSWRNMLVNTHNHEPYSRGQLLTKNFFGFQAQFTRAGLLSVKKSSFWPVTCLKLRVTCYCNGIKSNLLPTANFLPNFFWGPTVELSVPGSWMSKNWQKSSFWPVTCLKLRVTCYCNSMKSNLLPIANFLSNFFLDPTVDLPVPGS